MIRSLTIVAALAFAAAPLAAQDNGIPFQGIGGSVTLKDAPRGVLVHVEASGLTPGWHAIHFHAKADCSDPAFTSAGGHVHDVAVTAPVHGLLNAAANDKGDLPNIHAGADGKASAEIFTALTTMKELRDADGSALIVHANPDDYTTQPIGGAGARVGCAAIR